MSADSIYRGQREEGRGLLSVADSVNIERRSLLCHVSSTNDKCLKKYMKADELGPKEYKNQRRKKEHKIGSKLWAISIFFIHDISANKYCDFRYYPDCFCHSRMIALQPTITGKRSIPNA